MATPGKLIKKILQSNIDRKAKHIKTKHNSLKGISQDDIRSAIQLIFENIKMSLYKGSRVELRGFGHFDAVQYAARKARNPKTGEIIDLPIQHRVKFKAGKTLNYRINKEYREKKWKKERQ